MNAAEMKALIDNMTFSWKPTKLIVHNTGSPTLKQWHQVPGETRMKNLENYFKNERGWPSAPHCFVADDKFWPFTPFNRPGTHSPSWNGTSIGVEMVADFSTEDDDTGLGLKVKHNTAQLFAILCAKLHLDPDVAIKLHKEDPKTTHDCPGKDFEKSEFIGLVHEYLGHAGDYALSAIPIEPVAPQPKRRGEVDVDKHQTLNLREIASSTSQVLAKLPFGTALTILGSDMNGSTKWLRVEASGKLGWVAAQYVKEKA